VKAIDVSSLPEEPLDTMTHHAMLQSTRQLSVEDVQAMSLFGDVYRIKDSSNPKIGSTLREFIASDALGHDMSDFNHALTVRRIDGSSLVQVEVVGDTIVNIQEVLSTNGFGTAVCYGHVCSLFVSAEEVVTLASIPQVTRIHAPLSLQQHGSEPVGKKRNRKLQVAPPISVGRVTSEGVVALRVDKARAKYNVNGTGILIGIIQDSFNCLNGAENDTLSGDLPPSSRITILSDRNATECTTLMGINGVPSDRGRQMMQVVYDVAPGARFAFHSISAGIRGSEIAFLKAFNALADFGCDIIIDVLGFFEEPFYQYGPLAQAIDNATAKGISYFTATRVVPDAGAWEAPNGFVPSGISPPNSTGQYHLFGNRSDGSPIISQRVGIPNLGSNAEIVVFQWDQPSFKSSGPPGCQSDLDLILSVNGTVLLSGTDSNIGQEPQEGNFIVPALSRLTNSTVFFDMFIIHKSGPFPTAMKMIISSNTNRSPIYEFATNSTALYGKANSATAVGVCSVSFQNTPAFNVTPPNRNNFVPSIGVGTPILFDVFGNRTKTPIVRNPIRFCAPNRVSISIQRNTSAVGPPHVAGVAALLLQLKGGSKSLTPKQITQFLELTAVDMDDPFTPGFDVGFDDATGGGLVDALAALDLAAATNAPTKSPTKKPTKSPTKKPTAAPTKTPTTVPSKAPTVAPVKNKKCGVLRFSIFCPFSDTGCGLFKRIFKIGGC
jgi:hypothetical protein